MAQVNQHVVANSQKAVPARSDLMVNSVCRKHRKTRLDIPAVFGAKVPDHIKLVGSRLEYDGPVSDVRVQHERLVIFAKGNDFETGILEVNGTVTRKAQLDNAVRGELRYIAEVVGYEMRPIEPHESALGRHPNETVFVHPKLHYAVLRETVVARIMLFGEIGNLLGRYV